MQANKWKGEWVPIEVSPTTGAAIPYTKKEDESSPQTAPAVSVGPTALPPEVSGRSEPGGSRAAPGIAPAPADQLPRNAPAGPDGGGVAGPTALWWNLALYLQDRPVSRGGRL